MYQQVLHDLSSLSPAMQANLSPNLCSSAHPGLATMFRRITHSHVALQGLLPGERQGPTAPVQLLNTQEAGTSCWTCLCTHAV